MTIKFNKEKQGKSRVKGMLCSGYVALSQGWEGMLFSLLGLVVLQEVTEKESFTTAVLGVKELMGAVLAAIIMGKGLFAAIKKVGTKKGLLYFLSGMWTSIGNLCYLLGVALAGSTYGVILASLYPAFSLILMKVFFRSKQTVLAWVGVLIMLTAAIMMTILPDLAKGKLNEIDMTKVAGMLISGLAALFWGFEGIFIQKGSEAKGPEFSDKEAMFVRTAASAATAIVLIMPMMSFFNHSAWDQYKEFGHIWSDYKLFLLVSAASLNVVILRIAHVIAVDNVGPGMTAIISNNSFIVPAFFGLFLAIPTFTFKGSTAADPQYLFPPIDWISWVLMIPIVIGLFMVIYFEKPRKKKHEKTMYGKNV